MSELCIHAYAKINLFLEVTGKRPDGFHDIDTVMQTVSLCDELSLETDGTGTVAAECVGLDIPNADNLAVRAARLYLDRAGVGDGLKIKIVKHIPCGSGLAGGSADAAAVLRGLNSIYGAFGADALSSLAAELGSDVPFCVFGGCMRASGRGEILSALPDMPDCAIVIARGERSSLTAGAYAALDKIVFEPRANGMIDALYAGDLGAVSAAAFNRFEDTAVYEKEIAKRLENAGALTARLSGSGSAVFGVFNDEARARSAAASLSAAGYMAALCFPTGKQYV